MISQVSPYLVSFTGQDLPRDTSHVIADFGLSCLRQAVGDEVVAQPAAPGLPYDYQFAIQPSQGFLWQTLCLLTAVTVGALFTLVGLLAYQFTDTHENHLADWQRLDLVNQLTAAAAPASVLPPADLDRLVIRGLENDRVVTWMLDSANLLLHSEPIKQSLLREIPVRRPREALSAAIVEKLPLPIFQEVVTQCIREKSHLNLAAFLKQAILKNEEKKDRLLQAVGAEADLYNQVIDQLISAHNCQQVIDTLFPQGLKERLKDQVGRWIESGNGDCLSAFCILLDTEDPRMKTIVERLIETIVKDDGIRDTSRAVETAKKALDDLCKSVVKSVYKKWIVTPETEAVLKRHPEAFPKDLNEFQNLEYRPEEEFKQELPVHDDHNYSWYDVLKAYSELVNTP